MIFLLWQKKKIKLKNGTKYDDIQAGDSLGIFLKIFSPMLTESGISGAGKICRMNQVELNVVLSGRHINVGAKEITRPIILR